MSFITFYKIKYYYIIHHRLFNSLYVISKLGVADHILDRSVDYRELASKVNVNPSKLYRIIRYLSSEGYFILSDDGKVKLTYGGQYLRSDRPDSMRYCFINWNEEVLQSMHYMLSEVRNEGEAFELAFGKDIFSLYEERPESAEAFTKCMKGLFTTTNSAAASEYDYSQHHTLLDLGGGMGSATAAILKLHDKHTLSNSKLSKAIVFDLPEVVKHGDQYHEILQYQGGSFFNITSIPRGADVILINGVLHDWNDDECVTILKNAASVLESKGTIIVTDSAVPKSNDPLFNSITQLDVLMMTISSGDFRTYDEYRSIFSRANLTLKESRPTRSLVTLFILEK